MHTSAKPIRLHLIGKRIDGRGTDCNGFLKTDSRQQQQLDVDFLVIHLNVRKILFIWKSIPRMRFDDHLRTIIVVENGLQQGQIFIFLENIVLH